MQLKICDICGEQIRRIDGRYVLTYESKWSFSRNDICADCIKRIKAEIKQAEGEE